MTEKVTREHVDAAIHQVLVEDFDIDESQVTPDATIESLGLDSLDMLEIGQIVEQRYGVRVRGEDARARRTLSDITEMVMEKVVELDDSSAPTSPS